MGCCHMAWSLIFGKIKPYLDHPILMFLIYIWLKGLIFLNHEIGWFRIFLILWPRNGVATLALGSRPRQKGLQGCGPRGSPGVTPETPGSVEECEGVSHHTPKAPLTLGDGVPVDSRNFRDRFERSKLDGLWSSLYH
jgi:hypothetical protein